MDMVSILTLMAQNTKENGLMMFKKVKEKKSGSMEQCMLENTKEE
jgi:hypothetical protein